MDLEVQGSDIVLKIGHMNWAYEVLTTRWMTEIAACTHEPYWEDYTLSVDYKSDYANLTADGVAQYNLHEVKQNASSLEDAAAAWAWEPQNIDYVAMTGSDYNPWDVLTYQSWNSGDMYFTQEVPYDFTPTYFNLTSTMTLTIQLPQGDNVICYRGLPLPYGSISALKGGLCHLSAAPEVQGAIQSKNATCTACHIPLLPHPSSSVPTDGTVSGRVTTTSGVGISGADIYMGAAYATTTAADGNYTTSVPPGSHTVTAVKTGFLNMSSPATVLPGQTVMVNLSLTAVGCITGKVTTTSGAAISGAAVSTSVGGYSSVTSDDGSYSLAPVAAGSYTVTASKSGYDSGTTTALVTTGQTTMLDITLMPPAVTAGNDFSAREWSSSEVQKRGHITKAGNSRMRWLLVEAASRLLSRRKQRETQALREWAERIARRRGQSVAVVALARKLGGILYAMWRDGSAYDPGKLQGVLRREVDQVA